MNGKKSALAFILGMVFVSRLAIADGLQVTPVNLTLQQDQRAEGI